MTDVEKKESQKTVVAFITGLLIGGLLVWIFSSTPDAAQKVSETENADETTQTEKTDGEKADTAMESKTTGNEVTGAGSIVVSNQAAGDRVSLGAITTPTKNGWVVVREYTNGASGNILGAARYSAEEGLVPNAVELMRATSAGKTYQLVFFSNNGPVSFDVADDKLVEGAVATFVAQ